MWGKLSGGKDVSESGGRLGAVGELCGPFTKPRETE